MRAFNIYAIVKDSVKAQVGGFDVTVQGIFDCNQITEILLMLFCRIYFVAYIGLMWFEVY